MYKYMYMYIHTLFDVVLFHWCVQSPAAGVPDTLPSLVQSVRLHHYRGGQQDEGTGGGVCRHQGQFMN